MRNKMRILSVAALVTLMLTLAPTISAGKTPDGMTPAQESVCDQLKGGTPGLYGLCVAYCEAQDCEIDLNDPEGSFIGCTPGSPQVLANYRKKMQAGDPDMPCVRSESCPCWNAEEVADIAFSLPPVAEAAYCDSSFGNAPGYFNVFDHFLFVGNGVVFALAVGQDGNFQYYCKSYCDSTAGSCPEIPFPDGVSAISEEEYFACRQQVRQTGAELGFPCFID